MNRSKKLCSVLLILLIAALALSSCSTAERSPLTELICSHEWQEATCTQPKTCSLCGKTEGEMLPHDYEDTTCISQKPCTMCGTYDGMVLTHAWREDGKVCTLCGMDTRTPEEKFSEGLTQGLEENFRLAADGEEWKKSFLAEYDLAQPYREEQILGEELAFWVEQYYLNLDEIKEALVHYGTEQWQTVYTEWLSHDRALILYNINTLLPITVSNDYWKEFEALMNEGEAINSVSLLCEEIDFHDITGSDGRQTHEALVENSSLLDFKKFSLEIDLLDEDGNIVETKTINVRNWKQGVKKSLRFSTSAKFKTIDVKYANWVV